MSHSTCHAVASYAKLTLTLLVLSRYPSKGYHHKLQCGVYQPTNVISFSYELAELGVAVSPAYEKRQCNECELQC